MATISRRIAENLTLLLGILAWSLIAVAGGLYARARGTAFWPVVVTWDEWIAAILLLPLLLGFGRTRRYTEVPPRRVRIVRVLAGVALIVFALDLIVRALFGLGWKPFVLD